MNAEEAKRLKELEEENKRLKEIVADLILYNRMLKHAAEGKWKACRGSSRQSKSSEEEFQYSERRACQECVRSAEHRWERGRAAGSDQASGASGSVASSRAHTSGRNCVSSSALGEPAWLANSGSFASTLVR